jgi:hypothetical protein
MRTAALLPFVFLLAASPAAATVADDLCAPTDDPCVVSGSVAIDAGSTLDFGTRTLELAAGAKVSWSGALTITAGSCDFRTGSTLAEATTTAGLHYLGLQCGTSALAGAITTRGAGILVEGDGPHTMSGKIKAQGDEVGVIAWDSYGVPGDVTIAGSIQATSKVGPPPGEFRIATNFGSIVVTEVAKIKVKGAMADPFSEFFYFLASSGSLTLDGRIDARAKTGAYSFNFEANEDVVFGPKSQLTAKGKTKGPEVAINSQLAGVTLRGKIKAGVSAPLQGGQGDAIVHVCAGDDILVDGKASIDASSGGFESSIVMGAFDIVQVGTAALGAKLLAKTDGDIELCGGTTAFVTGSSTVVPDAESVGHIGDCLSPESQVIFLLDCNGD